MIGTNKPDFNFTGLYRHAKSGLDLAVYRAYDPDLERWLDRDPIGEKGGLNLYGYVGNNSVKWVDPLGLEVRAYSAPAWGIPNTAHVFFWSTTTNGGVGRNGSSGHARGSGIPDDFSVDSPNYSNYTTVKLPPNMTDLQFLDHVRGDPTLNDKAFLPYVNDCHNDLIDTAHNAGADVQDPAPRIDWLGAALSLFGWLAGAGGE